MSSTPTVADLVAEEERIDKLRLKAFKTNSPEDRQAYFNATSKWFQDRHYRRMDAALSPAATEPVAWAESYNNGQSFCSVSLTKSANHAYPLYAAPPSPVTVEAVAEVRVYCPSRLRAYLATLPKAGRYIMARNLTQPLGKRAVQKAVEDVREKIGAREGANRLVPHGWRYTAAKQLAEAGCSDAEIQAVTGHKTLSMVQKYRAQASQSRASKTAQDRRERTKDE